MKEFEKFKINDIFSTGNNGRYLTKKQKIIIASVAAGIAVLILVICLICCGSGGSSYREKSIRFVENCISRGFYDPAEAKLTELFEEYPDDEELWALMAKLQEAKKSGNDLNALLEQIARMNENGSSNEEMLARLLEMMNQNSGNNGLSGDQLAKIMEMISQNNGSNSANADQIEKLVEMINQQNALRDKERADNDKRLAEEKAAHEKQLEKERSENAKNMKEMQALLKKQQEQAEAEKARLEEQRLQQKAQEEQRKKEEALRKAQEEELARKNAILKGEIDAVNEAILLGKSALNAGDSDGALKHFQDAQKLLPVSQGEPDFSGSKYSEMASALWDASQNSTSPEVRKQLADTAKTYAETAVAKTPKDAASHYILGMYSYDRKDWPKALDELTKAITYDGNNYLYFYNLGRVQYTMKKYSAAKSSFGTACTLNASFAPARYNLGLTNNRLNDTKSALSDFRKAHDIEPRHEKAYLEEARLLSKLGDLNGSISAYLNVIKINNMNRDALNEIAAVYSRAKKLADSETYFRKSLALLPSGTDDPLTYYNLSSVLYEEDKIQEALSYAKKSYETKDIIKDASSKANIVYNYALISEQTGDVDGAILRYSEVLQLNSNHIKTCINLGNMYMEMDPPDTDKALDLFLKAYNIDRKNFEANNNLGSAYRQKKEYKEAVVYFLNALAIDSRNNEVRMNLAQAYASDQQYDNAKTTFLDVLKQDQSNWAAYLELSKVCMTLNDNESAEKYLLTLQSRKPDYKKDEVSSLLSSISGSSDQAK